MPRVSLENDPIKRAKHANYQGIMRFAKGEMASRLKKRLQGEPGRVAHALDGRENDVDAADGQADAVQDALDHAEHGRHGMAKADPVMAEHVGLGEKEKPLSISELHEHLKAGKHGAEEGGVEHVGGDEGGGSGTHHKLLADLSDEEVKKLLGC